MQLFETSISEPFLQEIARAESDLSLARAGLLFAQSEYAEIDCDWYLAQLDLIAKDIQSRFGDDATIDERLRVMNDYLFKDLGYSGNVEDYYDPRNSFLNEVIDRRVGLPITLSIVYLELSERLGIRARGISFPGHFLVGVTTEREELIVDAFDSGAMLARSIFLQRLSERAQSDAPIETLERTLHAATKKEILLRQLRNLKAIYGDSGAVEKSLNTINHMLSIEPDLMPELLERAALFDTLGYARGAVHDYERALALLPAGGDHDEIARRLAAAREKSERLH